MTKLFKTAIIFILMMVVSSGIYSQKPDKRVKVITPELIKEYVDFLASDSLKGRQTPSKELDIAADYIANQFGKFGVDKVNGSYFQPIPFCKQDLDITNSKLNICGIDFQLKSDYIPFEGAYNMDPGKPATGEIVFVGYGITAPELGYDDYDGIDVKGKIVLALKHEPGEKESDHSILKSKVKNAMDHGAIGFLLFTDPLNHMMLKPQGYPWPSLSKFKSDINVPFQLYCIDENAIPAIHIGENIICKLFGSVDSLKRLQAAIDKSMHPASYLIKGSSCTIDVKIKKEIVYTKNVVGFIKGSDKKKNDEIVIVGAHYDHVGFKNNHKEGEDYIFNGADDNASGTAGVMAVAKAFSSSGKAPARSILFILFSGEELGLIGSGYYCEHPLLPLDKSVAMINMDMISRNGPDSLQIEGASLNPDLAAILEKENKIVGLKVIPSSEEFFGRSDHYNFYKKGVSSVDIFTGLHKDYHTVNDNPDKIDPAKAAKVATLVYRAVKVIAEGEGKLKLLNKNDYQIK